MEEAIRKVLDLLEQGKISPEEAERLIRAIKEAQIRQEKIIHGFSDKDQQKTGHKTVVGEIIEGVGSAIGSALDEVFESAFKFKEEIENEKEINLENFKKLEITVLGGDCSISQHNKENVWANFKGTHKIEGDLLHIKVFSKANITIPNNLDKMFIKVMGGDLKFESKIPELYISIMGGEVSGKIDFEKLKVKIMGGDLLLKTPKKPIEINIKTFGGDYQLPSEIVKTGNYLQYGEEPRRKAEITLFGGDFTLNFEGGEQ